MPRFGCLLLLLGLTASLAGCTTKSAVFPDHTPRQVWTALITACEQPKFDDWFVSENNVWVDANFDRIEVQRRLKRDLHRHGSPTIREDELYEMQFILERTEPPVVTGTVRNSVIRAKGLEAIEHVFQETRQVLSPACSGEGVEAPADSDDA